MSGYGNSKWTCGECGEIFESDGVVGDMRVMRWRSEHKEEHRVEKMSPEERQEHYKHKLNAMVASDRRQSGSDS